MKISWNWLKRHADLSGLDPREVGNRFTMSVAELERVEELGATYDRVLVARVRGLRPHPNSDKLSLVELDLGDSVVEAVSGAPGIRIGSLIPFALPGTVLEGLPDKPMVRVTELRGVTSPGVTCSENELGISGDHSGLMVFPEGTPVGARLTDVLPAHDFVLEIDNTSITHRPDLWGHRGIAREIAAMTGRGLNPFDLSIPQTDDDPLAVSVEAPDLCPRYTALAFEDVAVAGSPLWMKLALSVTGVRPINNVVDITNFVMLDVGNPTHAFDARHLRGNRILVRRARPGERLTTLDGTDRELARDDVVIADAEGGVALGGVMGGLNSEIAADTSRVVLEAACFHPGQIRRTSSRLGLRTEASVRFEKGLDRLCPLQATALFSRLLRELVPTSRVCSRFYDVAAPELPRTVIRIAPAFIRQKLGVELPTSRMKAMLENLDFSVAESPDGFEVTVPTFRATRDVTIPEDVVEEIGRIYGYDNVPPQPPLAAVSPPPRTASRRVERKTRHHLASLGYFEVLSYSFDSAPFCASIGYPLDGAVELRNPISAEMPALRRSLVPNLLAAAGRNALNSEEFKLCELGRTFFPARTSGAIPQQERHVAGVVYSRRSDPLDLLRRVKGDVESLASGLGKGALAWGPGGPDLACWLVPGKTLAVSIGGHAVGALSVLNPVVRDRMKLRGTLVLFELDLEPLIDVPDQVTLFAPLPRYPAVANDLSVIVDLEVPHGDVERTIREAAGDLLAEVEMFALFRGAPIPEGRKSLSFHLTFRSPDRTLEDKDVTPRMQAILAALRDRVRGEIRVA